MSAEILREAAALMRSDCPIPEPSRCYDFIDFPTGFAIQRAGVEHVEECSAAITGGALLCDCEAIYPAWRRWRALLATADWLDEAAVNWDDIAAWAGPGDARIEPAPIETAALAVARAYLGESA